MNVSTHILLFHLNHSFITVIKSKNTVGVEKEINCKKIWNDCVCFFQGLDFRDSKHALKIHHIILYELLKFKRHSTYFSHSFQSAKLQHINPLPASKTLMISKSEKL